MPKQTMIRIWLFLLMGTHPAWSQTVTLVADEWPPFNKSGDKEQGYMIDLAREAFAMEGMSVEYVVLPWKRAIMGVRKGLYDGLVGATRTEVPDFVFPEEELAINYLSFFVTVESSWQFEGVDSLEYVTLAVTAGYDYRDWLNDYITLHKGDEYRIQTMFGHHPIERNLKLLLSGRVDVIVDNAASIRYTARQISCQDQIRLAGKGTLPAYLYIAFSPQNTDSERLAEYLSVGLRRLRSSGRLSSILERYGLKDWRH